MRVLVFCCLFFQAEDGIRDLVRSRGLGDVYKRQLSAYARQFLELMGKPDVDSIEGLSPAISIEQKTTSRNPRSTVGTVTAVSYTHLTLPTSDLV